MLRFFVLLPCYAVDFIVCCVFHFDFPLAFILINILSSLFAEINDWTLDIVSIKHRRDR